MEAPLYNQAGKKQGGVALPAEVFAQPWNEALIHQVVVSMHANERAGTAHTKDRSEVRGGGKKPWKQKGTGRARHGSTRSPIWVGGGIAHGPRSAKDYTKIIPKSMKAKAFAIALSKKAQDKAVFCIDALSFETPKTKDANTLVSAIKKDVGMTRGEFVIVLPSNETKTRKSFQNLERVTVTTAQGLNTKIALGAKALVFVSPETTFSLLAKRTA